MHDNEHDRLVSRAWALYVAGATKMAIAAQLGITGREADACITVQAAGVKNSLSSPQQL